MSITAWPKELVVVRHGESAGNLARDLAYAQGSAIIDIAERDCDVPLSQLGARQAAALGEWMAEHRPRPHAILSSPYLRARQTARLACEAGGWHEIPVLVDERLREKEFGMLDRLTGRGILEQFPEQAEMRRRLGKFYYRPPGGESWTDVILRLRSLLDWIRNEYRDRRILIVSHQVVVLCFRYMLERLSEQEILEIDRAGDVANCSVTDFQRSGEAMQLRAFNFVAPMREAGEAVTTRPDVPIAPK
ncbi:MAG: histidine phosphatase family protein [Candidatus Baltobacteraceae bacterium]